MKILKKWKFWKNENFEKMKILIFLQLSTAVKWAAVDSCQSIFEFAFGPKLFHAKYQQKKIKKNKIYN